MPILYTRAQFKTLLWAVPVMAFMFVLISGGLNAARAASPLFTVQDVKIDITADDAASAKDQAFTAAQGAAFRILASRMLSDSEMQSFQLPETDVIASMIQDFEVTSEQLSHVRYIGTFTVRFRDAEVRKFFSHEGVSYTDVSSRPVLVLPFYQTGYKTTLWDQANLFLAAWQRNDYMRGLVPVEVPIGDLSDMRAIKDNQALTYDDSKLSRMLVRYRTGEAVLLIAVPDRALASLKNDDDRADGVLNINIYRTDRAGPEFVRNVNIEARSGETRAGLFDRATNEVYNALQTDWKQQTSVQPSQANSLQVRVEFQSLKEWAEVQRELSRVYGLDDVVLQSISPREATLNLVFQGSERRLRLALAQADMSLASPRVIDTYFGGNGLPLVYDLYLNRYGRVSERKAPPQVVMPPQGAAPAVNPANIAPQAGDEQKASDPNNFKASF